ncbi:NodT family efflux transporter outer membrane factor (OMF) lipoprotein [Sphingomonas naasensis]|uniref:Efflux transporter outer membrane subunit n=1 Tax=Sphingomonas naasensis TaxID=1344951 RepID=A0A4S1WI25_9SPHN|nr:efflux transporter outer membrane subunit [Sphingomonas naasensis]NIJ21638.1 NodT family efflux transporter outer membrane factor (OMF) lipoprotein [Sphingomonas naasensis]TGX41427.1 efflux transporter outer membrane subunit [Sphingomonas naasensis]
MIGNRQCLAIASLALCLAACTVGPDYRRPVTTVNEAWLSPVGAGAVDTAWWTRFEDPLLTGLVESAIAGNKDLAEAHARLREARANRDAAHGRSLPQLGASAAATQSRLSENGPLPVGKVPGLGRDLAIYDLGFDASWEIDLWGGTRRAIESAEARAQAAEEARRGAILQVIAEVVRAYVDLRAAQSLRANAIADAQAQAAIAGLVADRLGVGLASRFDLVRAETQAHGTAATIPGFEADIAAAAFRIALLLGQPPELLYDRLRQPGALPAPIVDVAAGLRSDLLRRRPDIRQAERDLAAFTAEVGVATAELFPRLSLIGGIGLQAREPGDLASGTSLRFQLGPSLRWPIFSGGRIRAQIRAADARADAAMVRYERSVLTALSDSETAINRYASAGRTRAERAEARAAADEAVRLARLRYEAGEDDLTVLLQTQAAFSAADRLSIQSRALELHQIAALYKALAGGWEAIDTPQARGIAVTGRGD